MKRISRRWILCLLWCIPLKCTAQQIYTSRIVDSETEEPLPYAVVKLSSSRSTLTNRDGFFSLKALGDEDSLHISFIGYQKKSLIVRELPEVIRLSPVEKALKELTVLSVTPEWIVDKVRKKLHQEYKFTGVRGIFAISIFSGLIWIKQAQGKLLRDSILLSLP